MPWLPEYNPGGNLAQFGNVQLHGGDVGSVLASIIRQRMEQQRQPLEIAQMVQQARQQELVNALAQRKQAFEEQEATSGPHADLYSAMAEYYRRRPAEAAGVGTNAAAEPEIYRDHQGREWRRGTGGRWIPLQKFMQPPTATPSPYADLGNAVAGGIVTDELKKAYGEAIPEAVKSFSTHVPNPDTVAVTDARGKVSYIPIDLYRQLHAKAGKVAPIPQDQGAIQPAVSTDAQLQSDTQKAQSAIAAGADRDAVVGRLQQQYPGTDFSDL